MARKPALPGHGVGSINPEGRGGSVQPSDPRNVAHVEERRLRADALDLAGVSIAEIARTLQVSGETIRKDLRKVREQRRAEFAAIRDTALDREVARLERLRRDWVQAASSDIEAAKLMLAIHDRLARILGLNAPTIAVLEVEHRSPLAVLDSKLEAIEARAVESEAS